MKITQSWLKNNSACGSVRDWFAAQDETEGAKVVEKLMAEDKLDWANWLIVRIMDRPQRIGYAVFAAEQVLDIFEKQYPDDKRPRLAIQAAKRCIADDTPENRRAAADAAYASYSAAADDAAYAAYSAAADDAAYSATAAAYSAYASYAAYASYSAADDDAAYSAAADDAVAYKEIRLRILAHGLKLLATKGES